MGFKSGPPVEMKSIETGNVGITCDKCRGGLVDLQWALRISMTLITRNVIARNFRVVCPFPYLVLMRVSVE